MVSGLSYWRQYSDTLSRVVRVLEGGCHVSAVPASSSVKWLPTWFLCPQPVRPSSP